MNIWGLLTLSLLGVIASLTTATDAQESDRPKIITPSEDEIILKSGQNYTMICKGKRPMQFIQQDNPEEVTEDFQMEQRNITLLNDEYEVALDLFNVDRYAVGYYACFDDTVNAADVFLNMSEELKNTEHISYVYVFVNGSSVLAPMRALVLVNGDKFIIECRPTTPDIKVKLIAKQIKKPPDQYKWSPKIGFIFNEAPRSEYYCQPEGHVIKMNIRSQIEAPSEPKITAENVYFLDNETFSLNCTVKRNTPVMLKWSTPRNYQRGFSESNTNSGDPKLYNNYTVVNADKDDQGVYSCIASNIAGSKSVNFTKIYLGAPIIKMGKNSKNPIVHSSSNWRGIVDIEAYPPVDITVFKNNKMIKSTPGKCIITVKSEKVVLDIINAKVEDSGNYTIKASNKLKTNSVTFDFRLKVSPKINFKLDKKYNVNQIATMTCEATGYPLPEIKWYFVKNSTPELIRKAKIISIPDTAKSLYTIKSQADILARDSGHVVCSASNHKEINETQNFLVYDIDGGFGIINGNLTWYPEGQDVKLKCLASIYEYERVFWYREGMEIKNVINANTVFTHSHVATLQIGYITANQGGEYICKAVTNDGRVVSRTIFIDVAANRDPVIVEPDDVYLTVPPYQASVNLTCEANAIPPPLITWYQFQDAEEKLIDSTTRPQITTVKISNSIVRSTIMFDQAKDDDVGRYECRVTSERRGEPLTKSKFYNLNFIEKPSHIIEYITTSIVIVLLLLVVIAYLVWKNRKERQFRKELMAAGLLYFKEGQTKSLNKELGIDEQAELLPYDERFEFPAEKLKLGYQLGAGAFGVVYKAEARGIINAEETTTVAVKMVKKTADNMYIKALASELKIMVHLGRHLNIVNLLGACTKNVGKRELIVIVEYCKYGNIHNYLLKHREVFNDTLNPHSQERFSGSVNHGFSCSVNSGSQFDYSGSNQTQNTANTMLNTENSNRSDRKDHLEKSRVSESGYVAAPAWRSNYESDYVYDGRQPRPLNSCDLLKWAFQIARGMEYLANRKVLHGDLAARNILLCEDNIVKICDFGLARSMYKNDEYLKKENSPLPVKWLALECMTHRLFSTQSDVWSYGVVLWELFSLARTPYPSINPQNLLQWLSQGNRLERPQYADDKIYSVMKRCWAEKPAARPSFSDLQEEIGCFLEDSSRNRYIDLNTPYMEMNQQRLATEDYLNMLTAPDYNNLVTPSPHIYGNDAKEFFPPTPTQLQHDEQGYLQMSPASRQSFTARVPNTKFDFDELKLNPKKPNSYGSELTPMLALNDIQRSGSESDEGNPSPYQNVEAPIHEEVYDNMKNNEPNIETEFSNLVYILATDTEKKPQNNYTNIKSNGRVK